MNPAISVGQLMQLHRLGELYVKWATNPPAMSEKDLEELQGLSGEFAVDGTSALFAFQKQFQEEFGLTAENSQPLERAVNEAFRATVDARQFVAEAIEAVARTPRVPTPSEIRITELRNELEEARRTGDRYAIMTRLQQLRGWNALHEAERISLDALEEEFRREDESALAAEMAEETAVDREAQDAYEQDQVLQQAAEAEDWPTELKLLEQAQDMGPIPVSATQRIEHIRNSLANQATVHHIPAGVVQDSINTGTIPKVK